MINRLVPRTNLLSWKSLHISTAKHKKHPYASDSQICRPAQKAKDTYPSGAMCVVEKLHQQAEDSRSFDLDASPHSEELDLHMSDDATSAVVVALQCLGGERGDFSQSRQFQSTTEVRAAPSERSMANHACS